MSGGVATNNVDMRTQCCDRGVALHLFNFALAFSQYIILWPRGGGSTAREAFQRENTFDGVKSKIWGQGLKYVDAPHVVHPEQSPVIRHASPCIYHNTNTTAQDHPSETTEKVGVFLEAPQSVVASRRGYRP